MKYGFLPLAGSISVALLLSSSVANATNGYFAHGVGVRAQGVAGVGYALTQDALAAATNPAGTGLLGPRIDLGVTWFKPDRSSHITGNLAGANGNYDGNGDSSFLIPELALTRDFTPSISYGLAIYGNGGMNTVYDENPFAAYGSQGRAGIDLSQLFVTPSLAFKPTPNQSFGVAATFAYQRFEARGLSAFDNPYISSKPGSVTNAGYDSSTGWGVTLGWIGKLHKHLSLGLAWSSRIDTGNFNDYAGLFADGGGFDIPESYGAGLAWQALPTLTLAVDWQRIEYSETRSVGNPLSLLFTGKQLGVNDGPGFGWQDIDVVKLGAVYTLNDAITLRAGISHADQPIPGEQTFINILAPGVIEDHLSFGASWKTASSGEWTLSYTHAFEETVDGNGSIPLGFGGGEANLTMKQDIVGLGWSFIF